MNQDQEPQVNIINRNSNFISNINEINSINENIQAISRRAFNLQNRHINNSFWDYILDIKNSEKILFTPIYFLISFVVLLILVPVLVYNLSKISEERFNSLTIFESEDMNLNYLTITFISFFSTWGFHLFFAFYIFKCEYVNLKSDNSGQNVSLADAFYFNPCCFTLTVWYFKNNFFKTTFDVYTWLLFSIVYFVNFVFTSKLYRHSNFKISQITNTLLDENRYIIIRMKFHFIFLILLNLSYTFFLFSLLEESTFSIQYLIIFKVKVILILKGIYLFSKQIEYFSINLMNYKYLLWGTNLKEENFILTLSLKSKLQILNMILILHKLILGSFYLLTTGHALIFFFPILVMIVNMTYNALNNYNSYIRIKNFYSKLEDL